jgi:hypothetical protein
MAVCTPLPPRYRSGTTLDLPWYHRTVFHPPKHSPPPAPTPRFAHPEVSRHLMAIRRRFAAIQRPRSAGFQTCANRPSGGDGRHASRPGELVLKLVTHIPAMLVLLHGPKEQRLPSSFLRLLMASWRKNGQIPGCGISVHCCRSRHTIAPGFIMADAPEFLSMGSQVSLPGCWRRPAAPDAAHPPPNRHRPCVACRQSRIRA